MIHEYKTLVLSDAQKLNVLVKESGCRTWLIMTHGIGENLERHQYLIPLLSQYFNILLYDLRGHGKSTGKRAYIDNFSQFYDDLNQVIRFVFEKYKAQDYILFGHSMGALITAGFVQRAQYKKAPSCVFLSAPPAGVRDPLGRLLIWSPSFISKSISNIPISVPLKGLVDLKKLSHDGRVYQSYLSDENNCLSLHTKLLLQMIKEAKSVFSRPLRCSASLYVAWGSDDQVISPAALRDYFSYLEKGAKTLEIEGGYHELHNEIEKYRELYFEFVKDSLIPYVYSET